MTQLRSSSATFRAAFSAFLASSSESHELNQSAELLPSGFWSARILSPPHPAAPFQSSFGPDLCLCPKYMTNPSSPSVFSSMTLSPEAVSRSNLGIELSQLDQI